MDNPFKYGGIVTGVNFADREDELSDISRDLSDCEKLFMISPRRYGKSSLIINVLKDLESKNISTVYIDLYKATSLNKLLELFSREIALAHENKLEKAMNFLREILPGLRPKITVDGTGNPTLGIEYINNEEDTLKQLTQLYDLPQKLAEKKDKNFVVAFDEFQEILNFNGGSIEKEMRASFQHHDKVGYLFAGSKKHIISDMVYNKNRPFYKIGKVMNLGKIPSEKFTKFIEKKFKNTDFTIETGVIDKILELTENYPYNVQYLAHELWDMKSDKKKIKLKDVKEGLIKILKEETPFFAKIWDDLTLHQRNVLQAIAVSGGNKIFSKNYIAETDIGPASTLQTSIELLTKKEIIDKTDKTYYISDVFFKEWIKRMTV